MNLHSKLYQNREYQFWLLQLIGWTGWVTLFSIRDAYWGQPFERVLLLVIDAIAGLILTTALRYIYWAVWRRSVVERIVTVVVTSYLVAAIWQPIKNYSQFFYFHDFQTVEQYGVAAYFEGILGYSYFLMLGWSGLYFALKFYRLLQLEIERSIRAESLAHESQLRMLRYQLNPHFLFNTLNAISTLILIKDNDTANAMVSKLSHFLRYSLDKDPVQAVELEHEMNTMKLYLEIEQVRFEDRLKVEMIIDENARRALVPSLLLQPLIENSIKYAVAGRESGGTITISAKRIDNDLQLLVSDNGPGIVRENSQLPTFNGVGLANTQERLVQLYGDAHVLKFSDNQPSGLTVEVRIPYKMETGS